MNLTRRQALSLSVGATTLAVLGVQTTRAWASAESTEKAIKEAGKMRIEGKEYVMRDADVVHFLFNV